MTAAHDHLLCESCCTGRPPLDKGPSGFLVATLCDAGNGSAIRGLTHPERTQGGSEAQDFFAQSGDIATGWSQFPCTICNRTRHTGMGIGLALPSRAFQVMSWRLIWHALHAIRASELDLELKWNVYAIRASGARSGVEMERP